MLEPSPFDPNDFICQNCAGLFGIYRKRQKQASNINFKKAKSIPPSKKAKTKPSKTLSTRKSFSLLGGMALLPGIYLHVKDNSSVYYPAIVKEVEYGKVLIHYIGWDESHDEWIKADSKKLVIFDPTKPSTTKNCEPQELTPPNSPVLNSTIVVNQVVLVADQNDFYFPGKVASKSNSSIEIEYDSWCCKLNEWIFEDSERLITIDLEPECPIYPNDITAENSIKLNIAALELNGWQIFCNQCKKSLDKSRVFCTYCEIPSDGYDYESFDLCPTCFECNFPFHHHPRTSFALETLNNCASNVLDTTKDIQRPVDEACGFCCSSSTDFSKFVDCAFEVKKPSGTQTIWVHEACAKFSPEVIKSKDGVWYNVASAFKRGRKLKCVACDGQGATIGCFNAKCFRNYHLSCTSKSQLHFEEKRIFWCPRHEAIVNRMDEYEDVYRCDSCESILKNKWKSCRKCEDAYFNTFDLCLDCFETKAFKDHEHELSDFVDTSAEFKAKEKEQTLAKYTKKKKDVVGIMIRKLKKKKVEKRPVCYFCRYQVEETTTEALNQQLLCFYCAELSKTELDTTVSIFNANDSVPCEISDYTHQHYLTRKLLSPNEIAITNYSKNVVVSLGDEYRYTLLVQSSFFDIQSRAPRWATHSGQDYHGTWLPQIVHWAINRYTLKDEGILSNFAGRGTDAIECLLNGRRCVAVDINPAAVKLAQKNVVFPIPLGHNVVASCKPLIFLADARFLKGQLFSDASFDHILSHPPYKDCIQYSIDLEADLSNIFDLNEFLAQMKLVAIESYRLLKENRHLTLGIGDNRKECYFIPLSYKLFKVYMDSGFQLEEIIVRKQRHCQGSMLGSFLSIQHEFLMIQHEFVAIFRKTTVKQSWINVEELDVNSNKGVTMACRKLSSSADLQEFTTVWINNDDTSNVLSNRIASNFSKHADSFLVVKPPQCLLQKVSNAYQIEDKLYAYDESLEKWFEVSQSLENESSESSLAVIPHLECRQGVFNSDDWVKEYREFIIMAIRNVLQSKTEISKIIVGVKDIKVKIHTTPKIPDYSISFAMSTLSIQESEDDLDCSHTPISLLVFNDISELFSDCLRLKEYFVVVPSGFSCNSTEDVQVVKQKLKSESDRNKRATTTDIHGIRGSRKVLPIVHANYFVFEVYEKHIAK